MIAARTVERQVRREAKRYCRGRYGLKAKLVYDYTRSAYKCVAIEDTPRFFVGLLPGMGLLHPYETILAEVNQEYQFDKIRRARRRTQELDSCVRYQAARDHEAKEHEKAKEESDREIKADILRISRRTVQTTVPR